MGRGRATPVDDVKGPREPPGTADSATVANAKSGEKTLVSGRSYAASAEPTKDDSGTVGPWPALPCVADASVQGLGITKDLVVELPLSGRRGAAAAPREWTPRVDVDRAAPREARRGVSPPAGRVSIVIRDISGTWRQRRSPFHLVWGLSGVDRGEVLREPHVERYGPRPLGPCPTPDGRGQSDEDETRPHDRWTPDPLLRMGQRFGGTTFFGVAASVASAAVGGAP